MERLPKNVVLLVRTYVLYVATSKHHWKFVNIDIDKYTSTKINTGGWKNLNDY